LLEGGQWFSPGTAASSTTKNWSPRYGRNIAESGVKHQISIILKYSFIEYRTKPISIMLDKILKYCVEFITASSLGILRFQQFLKIRPQMELLTQHI
jgi:hypothetical protein